MLFTTLTLVITFALLSRIGVVLISGKGPSTKRAQSEKCSIAVFLGSGGHSTEMLQLIQALPEERYTPRIYLTSEGDQFSVSKAMHAEQCRHKDHPTEHTSSSPYQYIQLPRARNVHQSWLSTPISLLISFYTCIKLFVLHPTSHQTPFADVIFLNGPGTCVPIVMAIWLLRVRRKKSVLRSSHITLADSRETVASNGIH